MNRREQTNLCPPRNVRRRSAREYLPKLDEKPPSAAQETAALTGSFLLISPVLLTFTFSLAIALLFDPVVVDPADLSCVAHLHLINGDGILHLLSIVESLAGPAYDAPSLRHSSKP